MMKVERWKIELFTWILVSPSLIAIFFMTRLLYIWNISQWRFLALAALFIVSMFWAHALGTVRRTLLIENGYKSKD
jgi:hypothetical protein